MKTISKFGIGLTIGLFVVFATGYVQLANSQDSFMQKNEDSKGDRYVFSDLAPKAPPIKIPQISADAGLLLQSLLERVWVTKYFKTASEVYNFSPDMPLCASLPSSSTKRDDKNNAFLWREKCLPVKIWWKKNAEDLGGTAIVRMLDFDGAAGVLEDSFSIIKANSLGFYKLEEGKRSALKEITNEGLESYDSDFPVNYKYKLKTYSTLEGYFFLEERSSGIPGDLRRGDDEIRKFFSYRGKKYALTVLYNPKEFIKEGNTIEYSLVLPVGFFGMESDYKKGKTP